MQKAAQQHDQALLELFALYSSERSADNGETWALKLRNWETAIQNEDYWKLTSVLDQLGVFEVAANPEEISDLRARAVAMAAEPLLLHAREAVASGDLAQLKVCLRVVQGFSATGNWVASARKDILAPLFAAISEQCRLNRENFGKHILRQSDAASVNRQVCDDELLDFRKNVEPSIKKLSQVVGRGEPEDLEARESVAACLSSIASDFTWADRYTESQELYKEALSLAEGTLVAVQIERSLADNKASADHQRRYEGMAFETRDSLKKAQGLCQAVLVEGRSQIIREQDKSEHNKPICHAMLARFRSEVVPLMHSVLAANGPDHPAAKELRAEVALCLNSIATDFTWADEFVLSLQLRVEALSIGANTEVVDSINEGMARISESVRQERMFRELIPLKGNPALSTINGVGGKLYGNSDYDATTKSFVTTYYFTVLYFPILPLRRYRVIQEGKTYRFLGRLPLRKFDKWHLGIALGIMAVAVLIGVANSDGGTRTHATYQYTPDTPASSAPETSPDAATRNDLRSQIDAGRARLEVLKAELQPVADEADRLKPEIQELDSQLRSLDSDKSSGMTIDTDDYNAKVNQYNDLIARRKALFAAHQASLDEYEEIRKKDSALVAQYNALLK